MFNKKLCVAIVAFLMLHGNVQGKRSRKIKRTKPEDEPSTPQPSVVSYSTFGFNDVGTYEGFVPSSPDFAKFLSNAKQAPSTGEHSLGFPTSPETDDFGPGFGSQSFSGQSISVSSDGESPINFPQHPQSSIFFHSQTFNGNNDQHRNVAAQEIYGRNTEDSNAPIYGTKINSKNKIRSMVPYNHTGLNDPSGERKENYMNYNEARPIPESRPSSYAESNSNFFSAPNYPTPSEPDFNKPVSNDPHNLLDFPRVVDFTKSYKQYYPAELDTSRMPTGTTIPDLYQNNDQNHNVLANKFKDDDDKENKHLFSPSTKPRDTSSYEYNKNNQGENHFRNNFKINNIKEDTYNFSNYGRPNDNSLDSNYNNEGQKKAKDKPWMSGSNYLKKWKDQLPLHGYGYATNVSSMNFKYETDENKISKPFSSSIDEIISASSNIELPSYQFPDTDFSSFKKLPEYKVHEDVDEFANFLSYKEKSKPLHEYDYNKHKHLFTPEPSSAQNWGNVFKSSEYSSTLKNHPYSNKYKYKDIDEVVNIPRKPYKSHYDKPFESWSHFSRRPYKNSPYKDSSYKDSLYKDSPYKDWSSDVLSTRFKSEEDLLGLRNQDTSHPSYLPIYRPNHNDPDDIEYSRMVDRWRQSYLKSKLKDSSREYESYGSETKTSHVPVPKPYSIEVPHPVIVPVPQPYPVRVPIAKPVAVPVFRELRIPVEKPMPYLVYKDVPFPVEKRVPVPVEKEVPVPVVKPYPVHIPYIRPVFHHTKSREEYDSDHRDDDDYFPRPESSLKSSRYKKKVSELKSSSRNRPRRPLRSSYHDRNRRRGPERDRRHPADVRDRGDLLPGMRPLVMHAPSPFKRNDVQPARG